MAGVSWWLFRMLAGRLGWGPGTADTGALSSLGLSAPQPASGLRGHREPVPDGAGRPLVLVTQPPCLSCILLTGPEGTLMAKGRTPTTPRLSVGAVGGTQGPTGSCLAVGLPGRMAQGAGNDLYYVVPSWRCLCRTQ